MQPKQVHTRPYLLLFIIAIAIAITSVTCHSAIPEKGNTSSNTSVVAMNKQNHAAQSSSSETTNISPQQLIEENNSILDIYRLVIIALITGLLLTWILLIRNHRSKHTLKLSNEKQLKRLEKKDKELENINAELHSEINNYKQSLHHMEKSNKYGRLLLDSENSGIYGVDCAGTTTFVNSYMLRRTGWTEEDLLGKNIHEIVHHSKDDGSPYQSHDCPILWVLNKRETHHVLDDIFWCKDGSHFQAEYTVTPFIEDGIQQGALVVFKDITDRIKTESGLRESEERLQAIINNTTAVITLKSPDGRYMLVNKRFEEIFNISSYDILGLSDFDIFPSTQAAVFKSNDMTALESDSQQEFIEEIMQDDGLHTYLSVKFTLTRNDGMPYAICNVSTDITERKRTEDTLRRAQKMEAIGQLTGGIAHDFNNLLGIIVGNLDLLKDELEDGPVKQHAKSALKAALRGSDLTRRLLAFSRKSTPETRPLCVNQVITDMQNLIEKSLTASINVEVTQDDGLWLTDINQGELEDAIINLAVNARDAMPNGGELYIETSNRVISEAYTKSHTGAEAGNYILISVHDTGSGIDKDVIEKVLDPFFTTKPGNKGSGLGLSMVYGFVKRVRGYINISSELGRGTTVEIFLPRSNKDSSCDEPNLDSETIYKGGYETILVVDDEPELALIAESTLSKYGYRVLNAGTASEAIKILDSHPEVDLLFSDVVMPGGMDGFALAQHAKQKYPKIKTLLASGFTHKTNEQQYGEAGQSLLRKPYRKTELIIHVRKALDSDKEEI
jgi:PAS domain S-box-containing protein